MKLVKHNFFTCLALLAMSLVGQTVLADQGGGKPGYVTDIDGDVVRSTSGKCVRNMHWRTESAIEECDPDLVPKKVVKQAPPPPRPVPQSVSLKGGTLFDFDKAELKPEGKAELAELATKLQGMSSIDRIDVTGFTDSVGDETYNQHLSEQRAAAVKDYLIENGVNPLPIETIGMGAGNPVASNDTSDGRAQNRRVEIKINAERLIESE